MGGEVLRTPGAKNKKPTNVNDTNTTRRKSRKARAVAGGSSAKVATAASKLSHGKRLCLSKSLRRRAAGGKGT